MQASGITSECKSNIGNQFPELSHTLPGSAMTERTIVIIKKSMPLDLIAKYEPVIGLEVHVQLSTRTKIFCGCPTSFGAPPNTNVCPVCLGLPGALPVLSRQAVELGIEASLALHCTVNPKSIFARKNYFYPDLPKGYQISQYDQPLAEHGYVEIVVGRREKAHRHHPRAYGRRRGKEHPRRVQGFQPLHLRRPQSQWHASCRDRNRARYSQLRRGVRVPDRAQTDPPIRRHLQLRYGEGAPPLRRQCQRAFAWRGKVRH